MIGISKGLQVASTRDSRSLFVPRVLSVFALRDMGMKAIS